MGEELDKRLTLRLSESLSDRLQSYATAHNQSMNSAILTAIELLLNQKDLKVSGFANFEQRNFIGQIVGAKDIDQTTGIITVRGLVYRYITENNEPVKAHKQYEVTNINGNIVIIKEREN